MKENTGLTHSTSITDYRKNYPFPTNDTVSPTIKTQSTDSLIQCYCIDKFIQIVGTVSEIDKVLI